jgi:cation transport ATPase
MMNQPTQAREGARFRGLVIIWGAQVFSLVLLFTMMQVVKPATQGEANQTLLFVLAVLAITTFAFSFVLKAQIVSRAATEQRPDMVTTGYILAFALCEACAIFGMIARFSTGAREAIYFFVAALVGFLLHFPRRRHIDDASSGQSQSFTTTL